ncbi:MAG: hypothetical protein QOH21_1492 [Acidobacteriota bacterium]|nr:hypothetical protein [Acidobacteriota bacterium]
MRTSIVVATLSLLAVFSAAGQGTISPDALLQRGIDSYRADDYTSAVRDLQAAAQTFLSPERMQVYVNTGRFENLQSFEKALVYLTLAQYRLGRENDARETVIRLTTAERIESTFARLPLDPDATDFEAIAARLVPAAELPRNEQLARGGAAPKALPPVQAAEAPQRKAVQPTLAAERTERQKLIDELVAKERERIQREADVRIAAERQRVEEAASVRIAATERQAEERVAAERATAQAEAQRQAERLAEQRVAAERQEAERQAAERVAAAERDAEQRIATERAAAQAEAQRQTEQRLIAERQEADRQAAARLAEAQREADQRVAAERTSAQKEAAERVALAQALTRGAYLTSLRQAEAYATNDQVEPANDIYNRIAHDASAPREVLAEAAVGLYRTGAFRNATDAFARMVPFAKGEEDLRYYYAVALYEVGNFQDSKRELACALPFIQLTEDVARYRTKIEQTTALQAKND